MKFYIFLQQFHCHIHGNIIPCIMHVTTYQYKITMFFLEVPQLLAK